MLEAVEIYYEMKYTDHPSFPNRTVQKFPALLISQCFLPGQPDRESSERADLMRVIPFLSNFRQERAWRARGWRRFLDFDRPYIFGLSLDEHVGMISITIVVINFYFQLYLKRSNSVLCHKYDAAKQCRLRKM